MGVSHGIWRWMRQIIQRETEHREGTEGELGWNERMGMAPVTEWFNEEDRIMTLKQLLER